MQLNQVSAVLVVFEELLELIYIFQSTISRVLLQDIDDIHLIDQVLTRRPLHEASPTSWLILDSDKSLLKSLRRLAPINNESEPSRSQSL